MPDGSMPEARLCAKCAAEMPPQVGNGRPRKYCLACSPRKRDLKPLQLALPVACLVAGCGVAAKARGLCSRHYGAYWRARHPAYQREWLAKNPGRFGAEYQRQWRLNNPDLAQAIRKRGYRKNRAVIAVRVAARRRGMGLPSAETRVYRPVMLGDPCSYCGAAATEVDHIDPVAMNGANDWQNLTASCRTCNARKGKLKLLEFLCLIA